MNKSFIINLERGVDQLYFGSSMDDAKNYLGLPDRKSSDKGSVDPDDPDIAWYYDSGISLFFTKKDNLVLNSMEVSNPKSTLWGVSLFDKSWLDIVSLFKSRGFKEYEIDRDQDNIEICFHDASCTLFFENEKLDAIQWSRPSK